MDMCRLVTLRVWESEEGDGRETEGAAFSFVAALSTMHIAQLNPIVQYNVGSTRHFCT